MKKTLIFFIFIVIQSLSYSQTKEETSDWLIGKLNENSEIDNGINNETVYFIKNGNLFKKTYYKTFNFNSVSGIPIKSIKRIIVYKDKISFHFDLDCQSNCINDQINNVVGEVEENTGKLFHTEINNQDATLFERISKSLVHLVKLYGGIPQVVYQKEPF